MQDSIATPHITTQPVEPVLPVTEQENPVAETAGNAEGLAAAAPKEGGAAKKAVVRPAPVKARHEIPRLLMYPYTGATGSTASGEASAGSATENVATADSVAADSAAVAVEGEIKGGIILSDPASAYREAKDAPAATGADGMSWIYLALAVLFCVTGIKFKGSSRYMKALVADLTDTRVRHNAFDDTVKETSLLVLLNLMWTACAGILLWTTVRLTARFTAADSVSLTSDTARGIGLCMGVAGVYMVLLFLAYLIVGNVFSDRKLTRLWLKGAGASTGLQTFLMFPLALLALSYPASSYTVLIIAAVVFIIGKIVFLYKGFRIFFTQISSWMLFLYYLCSLEIVPLILTYVASVAVCTAGH